MKPIVYPLFPKQFSNAKKSLKNYLKNPLHFLYAVLVLPWFFCLKILNGHQWLTWSTALVNWKILPEVNFFSRTFRYHNNTAGSLFTSNFPSSKSKTFFSCSSYKYGKYLVACCFVRKETTFIRYMIVLENVCQLPNNCNIWEHQFEYHRSSKIISFFLQERFSATEIDGKYIYSGFKVVR